MTLALYLGAALLITYFSTQAFSGSRGLKAKQDLAIQMSGLAAELAQLKEERGDWQRRVALLRSDSLDPDMLDERARAKLDYVHARDLVLVGWSASATPAPQLAAR